MTQKASKIASQAAIKSPCIKVCAVDGETGLCLGCGRTLPEIGGWVGLGEEGREAVMAQLPERLDHLRTIGKLNRVS